MTRYTLVILTLAGIACGGPLPPSTDPTALLAQSVTIYRDRYGVPYIHGPTDASAVFGFAYAQAEDHFDQIEDSYIHALVGGESGVPNDWLNRALEVTSLSQADYGRLGTRAREICDAFAAGLNFFLRTHPHVKPRLLTRFENWHVLALIRHRRHQRESVEMSGLSPGELKALGSGGTGGGSNALVGPSKSAAGGAMLIAAPHRQFFGADQFYEGHLRSDEGWRLADFRGKLQADAYAGYDGLYQSGHVVEIGCMAHARRRFVEAFPTDGAAALTVALMERLYQVERAATDLSPDARRALRLEHSVPLLAQIKAERDRLAGTVLPKSPLGDAVRYLTNQWDALQRFVDDGRLAIDSNRAENQLRVVAVGRKNWLFAGSMEGARRAAFALLLGPELQARGGTAVPVSERRPAPARDPFAPAHRSAHADGLGPNLPRSLLRLIHLIP